VLTGNGYSRTGYTFAGWASNNDGTGTSYTDGQSVKNLASTTGATVTLYAKWTANTYTISFDNTGGTGGQTATVTATYDSAMPSITASPTRIGYAFNGYWDAATGGNKYYNADRTSATNWNKTANTTLYAQWSGTLNLGDTGPGGGKIFYYNENGFTMTYNNEVCHYLEAAPADMPTTLAWASSGYLSTNMPRSTDIGVGRNNTALIRAMDANAPAAKACRDYSNGGMTDWFLPSRDELDQLYVNRAYVGNMTTNRYWSSSQGTNAINAWDHDFDSGYRGYTNKVNSNYVRAVRAF
jgi:uncharacterized repeat protein (TIGR02543 family)